MPTNFKGSWVLKIYDNLGNLVDIPQTDVYSIDVEDGLNGGSGQGTVVFQREFNKIGNLAYGYQFQLWFWPEGGSMLTDPWYSGHLVDFDQEQLATTGRVTAKLEGDFKLLDAAIVSLSINPGVAGNPNLSTKTFLQMVDTIYRPPSFGAAVISPTVMPNLLPMQFDASKLGAVIDTTTKTVRDSTGLLYTWFVRTQADLTKRITIQVDQNPNVVAGVPFKHLFVGSQLDQYKIATKYRDIINVVAVYGGKDPVTGQQVYGAFSDAVSLATYGAIEDKISVPALSSNAAAQSYATTWLLLHAYPQAQGDFRLLICDPTIFAGTWVQIWETPTVVKQIRAALVKVSIKGERIEQSVSTQSPVPYLDSAIYRMGVNVQTTAAIASIATPVNTQNLFIRFGGVETARASSPAKVALSAGQAVFPSGVVSFAALALTQLTDTVSLATGDGAYTVCLTSAGAWVIVKGDTPQTTSTQQNILRATVVGGVPLLKDVRTLFASQALNGSFDNNGNLVSSTPVNQQASLNPYVSDVVVSSAGSWPGGGGTPTITVSWTAFTIIWPDGVTVTSVAAGSKVYAGLVGTTTYHFAGVYYDTNLGQIVVIPDPPSSAAITITQRAAVNFDGRVGMFAAFDCATPAASGGSTGGGGGHPDRCPAAHQKIRTLEHGRIRADELKIGMHLYHRDGSNPQILALRLIDGEAARLCIAGQDIDVDVDHAWLVCDRRGEFWIPMSRLTLDHSLVNVGGEPLQPEAIEYLGPMKIQLIQVEGGEFMIDTIVGHNMPIGTL
ncbi:MAG: hypothetical protein ACR2KS_10095 [Candidatus Eremiobacter antarcticus]|nr:hypothetical protein [Candidatus Eremiobacteraeota bacterium]MBC5808784.1 hypothetical protein [Candidatus Eremiobacteraeota bacterium]